MLITYNHFYNNKTNYVEQNNMTYYYSELAHQSLDGDKAQINDQSEYKIGATIVVFTSSFCGLTNQSIRFE